MTNDLEAQLRKSLAAKAATVTERDLTMGLPGTSEMAGGVPRQRAARRPFAVAAALLAAVAIGAAVVSARNVSPTAPSAEAPSVEVDDPASAGFGPAWPLTNDEPLPDSVEGVDLRNPDAVARAYLTTVVGLPADWPLEPAAQGKAGATVRYVLQDVPARMFLNGDGNGHWFVMEAQSELVDVGVVPTSGGIDVTLGPGARTYEAGAPARITALAASGRELATATKRVPGPSRTSAAAATVVPLRWTGPEVVAAVRVDVLDDHDSNPATPDVTVGHWTRSIDPPRVPGLPEGTDIFTSAPLFTASDSATRAATAYMKDRFPDYPAPGIKIGSVETRGPRAWVEWSSIDGIKGTILLRARNDTWDVIAAGTEGVDLGGLQARGGRIQGRIKSTNINSLFADVLRPDGTPIAGAPRPEGSPGAAYRFGTAGGPGNGSLVLDLPLDGSPTVIRVHLVGGTLLSISEVATPSMQP